MAHTTTLRRLFTRAATILFVGALLCVPGLTRVGQRITTSQAPTLSFSKSTDLPPKKIAIEHVRLIVSLTELRWVETTPVRTFARPADATAPPAFTGSTPRPLRAPPSARLA